MHARFLPFGTWPQLKPCPKPEPRAPTHALFVTVRVCREVHDPLRLVGPLAHGLRVRVVGQEEVCGVLAWGDVNTWVADISLLYLKNHDPETNDLFDSGYKIRTVMQNPCRHV